MISFALEAAITEKTLKKAKSFTAKMQIYSFYLVIFLKTSSLWYTRNKHIEIIQGENIMSIILILLAKEG